MKRTFLTALLFSSFLSPVFAADINFTSAVEEVTVYPRGAQITRTAIANIPAGDHVIIIKDLPGDLNRNSIRVEGTSGNGIEIGSVDVRQTHTSPKETQDKRRQLEELIRVLGDEIALRDQTVSNANIQRALLQNMASQAILPRPTGQGGSVAISASDLDALLTLTDTRLKKLSAITEKARKAKRALSEKRAEFQKKLDETAPRRRFRTTVSIHLSAQTAGDASFRIRYNVANAGWTPAYDAKLKLGEQGKNNTVKLVRRAKVRQSTTESWDKVKLTLSTARPSAATKAPVLHPYILSERKIVPYAKKRRKISNQQVFGSAGKLQMDFANAPQAPVAAMITRKPIAVTFSGFLAEYKIPSKVSIENKGSEKNVTISEQEFAAEISVNTTPKSDKAAYLAAKFKLKGKSPYLPGEVLLSRDGVFLGRGRLPSLNPDEEFKLSFGRDNFIKVDYRKVAEKAGESGIVSRSKEETRKFVTTVTNLHDFPIKLVVNDQFPYATHEDIKVNMTSGSTKPTKTDVDKKRGVVLWEKNLTAKEKYTINFGYTVSWPKKMRITPVR